MLMRSASSWLFRAARFIPPGGGERFGSVAGLVAQIEVKELEKDLAKRIKGQGETPARSRIRLGSRYLASTRPCATRHPRASGATDSASGVADPDESIVHTLGEGGGCTPSTSAISLTIRNLARSRIRFSRKGKEGAYCGWIRQTLRTSATSWMCRLRILSEVLLERPFQWECCSI